MDRAHRSLLRARRRAGRGHVAFPATTATATASARRRSSRTSATTSARAPAGASALSLLAYRAEIAATTTSTAPASPVTNSFTGTARTWVLDGDLQVGAGRQCAATNFKLQGEYFRRHESGTLTYDTLARGRRTSSGDYALDAVRLVPAGGLPVHAAVARRRALRPARFRHAATSAWSTRRAHRRRLPDPAERSAVARRRDGRLLALGIQPLPAAARRRPRSPAATDRQIFLQYIMSLGAHGAHTF